MNDEVLDLPAVELEIQKQTVEKQTQEFELIERTKQALINGLNLLGAYKIDKPAETAKILITIRSFQSFRCSIEPIKKAYYNQAVAILRMMTEDFFILGNLDQDPQLVNLLLSGKPNTPSGKKAPTIHYYTLAKKMKALKVYETYRLQCDFTHCSNQSIGILIDSAGKITKVKIASAYDKTLFMMCCEMLIMNSLRILYNIEGLLKKLPADNTCIWQQEFVLLTYDINKWRDNLQPSY
jgi:hypothetical protein